MKVLISAFAFCLLASSAFATETRDLVGNWRLATATRLLVDTNEVIDAYGGPRPTGWLNYSPDGRMMVVVAFEGRKRPEANDKMTDEDRVGLHKSFYAYTGTYAFDGQKITHKIDVSWNEVWTGTSQVRNIDHKDENLVITTPPFKFNVDGKMSVLTLTFARNK